MRAIGKVYNHESSTLRMDNRRKMVHSFIVIQPFSRIHAELHKAYLQDSTFLIAGFTKFKETKIAPHSI